MLISQRNASHFLVTALDFDGRNDKLSLELKLEVSCWSLSVLHLYNRKGLTNKE